MQIQPRTGPCYKTFVNKHICETTLLTQKNKLHPLSTYRCALLGSWTRLSFPYNQKHTSLETFFRASPVQCSRMKRFDGCALAPVDACTGAFFREKCPCKEFHRRLRQQEPWFKKTFRNLYEPWRKNLTTEILSYFQIVFWNFGHA